MCLQAPLPCSTGSNRAPVANSRRLGVQVSMRTLSGSELAVAVYPTFSYNSSGGGGVATAQEDGSIVHMTFDPSTLTIPDVNYRNTTFMGVPMAPPFSIAVKPRKLEVGISFDAPRAQC